MFFQWRIAPHLFQFVKFAGLGTHDVHDDVDVIDQHPLKVLLAFMPVWKLSHIFLYRFFHRIGDGPDLGLVIGFTNDEKVGNGLRDLAQVKRYNVLALFILYGPDDGFVDFRCSR